MREPQRLARKPATGVVVDFPDERYSEQMNALVETLRETNAHLSTIAGLGNDTLSFFRKWVPWIIAAAGVLYPAVGKVIQGLPSLPH